ncbi:MAG TPA: hypothetical protein VGC14_02250 [Rhizobium sp.]
MRNHFTPAITRERHHRMVGFAQIVTIILINDILAAAAAIYVFGFGG